MLKLTYTENGFYLECLGLSVEEWVQTRVILALRVAQSLCVEPSTASFLLPADLPGIEALKAEAKLANSEIIDLSVCDAEYVEVSLRGYWLSDGSQDADGVFVTAISDSSDVDVSPSRTEFFLHKLWREAQACASVMSEG
ncbi:alr0857 family protein [Anabaena sp. CA = ATCC 33047]|uniref:alr0857 family protein n=1 Tax=Anabaena sp. (strain CA / ATCC 33047) TaxID=52271 RepID=UPI00083699BA|nr:alr0857 family protein [Anabaena sp. CA = ATCC 33047]